MTPGESTARALYCIRCGTGKAATSLGLRLLVLSVAALGLILSPSAALAQEEDPPVVHVVAWGETLWSIATQYSVTPEAIIEANHLTDPNHIYAGQRLVIPGGVTPQTGSSADSPGVAGTHVVQRGETLFQISQRYGVSVSALAELNGLWNPAQIYEGQQLRIPGAATTATSGYSPEEVVDTHVVKAGETLSSIARRYGVPLWVLAQVNNISNPSLLYAGQVLTVPRPDALSTTAPSSPELAQKSIIVDISDQRAYVYENGQLLWTFVVSTGIPGAETWRGTFQIQNKIPVAYASTWGLQMPYWLGFYWAGPLQNGFHALPILSNGERLWAGALGRPASYGCVILSEPDARLLYEWADIGTPVTVRD